MKKVLAIDFGLSHVGLAVAETPLAESLDSIHYNNDKQLFSKLLTIISQFNIKHIVVGLSEGEMAKKTKVFVSLLKKVYQGAIYYQDETLTTQISGRKMIKTGKSRSKRRKQGHQVAACQILQDFIDEHPGFLLE